MKKECKEMLEKYTRICQAKYLPKDSIDYKICQKIIQDYRKCIDLQKHLKPVV